MAHLCWFLKATPVTAPLVDAYPAVSAWFTRVMGFGHGAPNEMTSEQALDVARGASPATLPSEPFDDPNGFKAGDLVTIAAVDYGCDAVAGSWSTPVASRSSSSARTTALVPCTCTSRASVSVSKSVSPCGA